MCIACNVNKDHPATPWFPGSVVTFAEQRVDGSFKDPYLVYAPEPGNTEENMGTEDPRLSYDPATGLYHLFYTCYGSGVGKLCHSTTLDPTAPYPGKWTRLGAVFGPGTKSGALLIRPSPPHYRECPLGLVRNHTNMWNTFPFYTHTYPFFLPPPPFCSPACSLLGGQQHPFGGERQPGEFYYRPGPVHCHPS